MDKQGDIHDHSREKLAVYYEYLRRYLLVMTRSSKWNTINVIDVFAGMGVSNNDEHGSALIAAKATDSFREEKYVKGKKNLQLFLNEGDDANYAKLEENLSNYDFPEITNKSADDFVGDLFVRGILSQHEIAGSHSFLFIDPYGYTQLSQTNLNRIFDSAQTEILIFVPTNSIYRFSGQEDGPAHRFLRDFGIEESAQNRSQNLEAFVEKIKNKIKEKAKTCFVYSYGLSNKKAKNSSFHLFFVTRHVKGAAKFLEAKTTIKKRLENQVAIFDVDEPKKESDVQAFLSQERSSRDLYVEIIKMGYPPQEIHPILKSMEKRGELKVRGDKRRKGAFYLNEKHEKIIYMRVINHEQH